MIKLGGSSFEIEAEIYQGKDLCAHSLATMVWVDAKTHKPKKLTDEVKGKIACYEGLSI